MQERHRLIRVATDAGRMRFAKTVGKGVPGCCSLTSLASKFVLAADNKWDARSCPKEIALLVIFAPNPNSLIILCTLVMVNRHLQSKEDK